MTRTDSSPRTNSQMVSTRPVIESRRRRPRGRPGESTRQASAGQRSDLTQPQIGVGFAPADVKPARMPAWTQGGGMTDLHSPSQELRPHVPTKLVSFDGAELIW